VSSEFVAAMEEVLELYARPVDPQRPRVCFDETPKQLIAETRPPLPARPGQPERFDYEYRRNGICNLFLLFSPDDGWRHVAITDQRTRLDFAHQMQWLVNVHYPDAELIDVVLDNLNIHRLAALYEAFEPAEARRIARKLVLHYTPKHGSWLNMAELEISVFNRLCWDRRIGDRDTLARETLALENTRNAQQATVHWQFTCQQARTRLHRLYPSALS
jgi:hypothetical protein